MRESFHGKRCTDIIAIDTETCMIQYPDEVNPTLVCISLFDGSTKKLIKEDRCETEVSDLFKRAADGEITICGANIAFDLCVLIKKFPHIEPLIWKSLIKGSISDIQVRERLKHISTVGRIDLNNISLAKLVEKYLGEEVEGKEDADAWRFRYEELIDVPISLWPREAYEYAMNDAKYTRQVWIQQEFNKTDRKFGSMNTESIQVAAAFCLRLATISGIVVDQSKVGVIEGIVNDKYENSLEVLQAAGLVNENGTRNYKAIQEMVARCGVTKTTPAGKVATDRKTLENAPAPTEELNALLSFSSSLKAVTTFVPQMKFDRIHPEFNVMVSTMRTSCRSSNYYKYKGGTYGVRVVKRGHAVPSINFQQIPRMAEFRAPFVPEPGHVFIDADYSNLELVCFAQTCYELFGFSDMREELNKGHNLHDVTGSEIYKLTNKDSNLEKYKALLAKKDDNASHARHMAKIINLGIPGGQSPRTASRIAKNFNLDIPEEEMRRLFQMAKGRFKEYKEFFGICYGEGWINQQQYKPGVYGVEVGGAWLSNRSFTEAANAKGMQALGALGAKCAMCKLTRACRGCDPKHKILNDSSMKALIHDEFLVSTKDEDIDKKCDSMALLMLEGVAKYMPDVLVSCEVNVQDYWSKYNTKGRPSYKYSYFKGELNKEVLEE